MFDGTGAPLIEDAAVLVGDNGRILEAGPASDVSARGAEVIACEGTLMPGLIDCHVHLCLSGEADPVHQIKTEPLARTAARATGAMYRYLTAGITTIRDLGGIGGIPVELGKMVTEGNLLGPRVVSAGQVICVTGGHCYFMGREADGRDEITCAVREQVRDGADCIKLMATGGVITPGSQPGAQQMAYSEMEAAVEAAHGLGRKVAVHAHGREAIRSALEAGVDTIEHGTWLDDEAVAFMKANNRFLVPTFSAAIGILGGRGMGVPDEAVDKMAVASEAHAVSFKKALQAGVSIVAGSDAGTPLNPHGSLPGEVRAMMEHGVGSLNALASCTGRAAQALGLEDVGVLAEGYVADIIEIDGDPTEDPWALSLVRRVVQGGAEHRSLSLPL